MRSCRIADVLSDFHLSLLSYSNLWVMMQMMPMAYSQYVLKERFAFRFGLLWRPVVLMKVSIPCGLSLNLCSSYYICLSVSPDGHLIVELTTIRGRLPIRYRVKDLSVSTEFS